MSGVLQYDDGTPIVTASGSSITTDTLPLVIEDGSIVAGANSYVTTAAVRLYAATHGEDSKLPADDAALARLVLLATTYVDSKERSFLGQRWTACNIVTDSNNNNNRVAQQLAWPREGVWIYGFAPGMSIPQALCDAVCQCVCEISNGFQPFNTVTPVNSSIKRKTVGPVTTEYFDPRIVGSGQIKQRFPLVEAILAPLCKGGTLNAIRTVRV